MFSQRSLRIAAASAALLFPLSLAACSGSGSDSGAAPSAGAASSAGSAPSSAADSPSTAAGSSTAPFGAACSSVPKTGKGSFDGMSQDPVATAASNNKALSTLVTAVGKAKLADTLNNAQDITVFAPTNDAFAAVPKKTMTAAMGDPKGLLTDVLTAHVVKGRLSPDQLDGSHDTLNTKQKLTVTGSGSDFTVNGEAMVVCGNVQTANATVYIIDHVLLPKS